MIFHEAYNILQIDVKKTAQELYGLINYGELRRKLPRIHEKVHLRLNELVYWGSTQVRLRGKTMRIKTPICRALRKLNQLEGIFYLYTSDIFWIIFTWQTLQVAYGIRRNRFNI